MVMHVRVVVLALALLAPATACLAADENAAPGTTEIHLTQQATRMIAPDRLTAQLRVEVKGGDARQVQAEINRRMKAATDKAKTHPDVTSVTGTYSVNRDFNVKDNEDWQGSQSLVLSSKEFATLLDLVGALQNGGLLVSSLQFHLARETLAAAQSELTATALAALKTRADEVAKDLGMRLDRFKDITIGNAGANTNPMPMPMMRGMASATMPPPVAQAADATVALTVEADAILTPIKP